MYIYICIYIYIYRSFTWEVWLDPQPLGRPTTALPTSPGKRHAPRVSKPGYARYGHPTLRSYSFSHRHLITCSDIVVGILNYIIYILNIIKLMIHDDTIWYNGYIDHYRSLCSNGLTMPYPQLKGHCRHADVDQQKAAGHAEWDPQTWYDVDGYKVWKAHMNGPL